MVFRKYQCLRRNSSFVIYVVIFFSSRDEENVYVRTDSSDRGKVEVRKWCLKCALGKLEMLIDYVQFSIAWRNVR